MASASVAYARPVEQSLFPTTAKAHMLGYVGRTPGTAARDSDAWYTPSKYVESARYVMGSIDLDPFSSLEANMFVQAKEYFSLDHSALEHRWRTSRQRKQYPLGRNIWMNPPYSSGLIHAAIQAFLHAFDEGDIRQAIVLVNNASDTKWFRALRTASKAVCFTDHRIAFLARDGKHEAGNTRGQVFWYFAQEAMANTAAFIKEFSQYGWVIDRAGGWIS